MKDYTAYQIFPNVGELRSVFRVEMEKYQPLQLGNAKVSKLFCCSTWEVLPLFKFSLPECGRSDAFENTAYSSSALLRLSSCCCGLYVVRTSQTIGLFLIKTVLNPICGKAALLKFSFFLRSNVKRLIFALRLRSPAGGPASSNGSSRNVRISAGLSEARCVRSYTQQRRSSMRKPVRATPRKETRTMAGREGLASSLRLRRLRDA